jgi:hypothetical protein
VFGVCFDDFEKEERYEFPLPCSFERDFDASSRVRGVCDEAGESDSSIR